MTLHFGMTSIIVTPSLRLRRWAWISVPGPRGQTFWHLGLPVGEVAVIRRKP